jgi:hypothetical protein
MSLLVCLVAEPGIVCLVPEQGKLALQLVHLALKNCPDIIAKFQKSLD